MTSCGVHFDPDGSAEGLRNGIARLAAAGARGVQVLAACDNGWSPAEIDPILRSAPVPTFGGVFPGVIHGGRAHERGTVLIGHANEPAVVVLRCEERESLPENWMSALESASTIFLYLDSTCPVGELVSFLFNNSGTGPAWIGGGTGALDFEPRPTVVTPEGLVQTGAVLAGIGDSIALEVSHGWRPIGEPLLVTDARGNDLLNLGWRPAFEVYRERVEAYSGRNFDDAEFYELASNHPLILERLESEGIVRDPIALLPGGGLRCAGDIPPHATVRIAHGEPDEIIAAAGEARQRVEANAGEPRNRVALTIDCISRSILLGERLVEELATLEVENAVQVGALTIGEIASKGDRVLQLHNKTTVLALLDSIATAR
jgi:hypothetical protein